MSFSETVLVLVPALGVGLSIGLLRRGHIYVGPLVASACIGVATVAAIAGNTRPIVGLFAFAMLAAAFVADERHKRTTAIACFSAFFLALIVAVMYT
jgi:hypothetical protein